MRRTKRLRAAGRILGVTGLLVGLGIGDMSAQRPVPVPIENLKPMPEGMAARFKPLSQPTVSVFATPIAVTIGWKPVEGATSYTVEQSTNPNGPWFLLPLDPRFTQLTAPTAAGNNTSGGTLYYYRISAVAAPAPPGVTVVSRVTPPLAPPLGVDARQEAADMRVTWAPVPHATGYVMTAAATQQSLPTHTVEVGPQYTEARLLNVALPNIGREVWIGVNARYGTSGAMSSRAPIRFMAAAVQYCWPSSSAPATAPVVTISASGPTGVNISTSVAQLGIGATRVERAVPQGWQGVGCNQGPIWDWGLAPGTQYQYRVSHIGPTGGVGQSIVVATTPPFPDNPTPTATVSSCTSTACIVTLNWTHSAGAEDYHIESSYGLYAGATSQGAWLSASGGTPISRSYSKVPKGVHTFYLTSLFPRMRPNTKAPGQVTVVVP